MEYYFGQGVFLTLLSSILCVLGCLVIYFENIYYFIVPKFITKKYPIQLKDNFRFLNGSMAFSSGCLLFTALFKLLPEALNYFEQDNDSKSSNLYVIISFACGIIVCLSFNAILHFATSESVVHCDHDGQVHGIDEIPEIEAHENDNENHHENHDHNHSHSHSHSHERNHNHSHDHNHTHHTPDDLSISSETSPLLKPTLKPSKSMIHFFTQQENDIGECKGYTSAELCLFHHNTEQSQDLHFCEIPELESEQVHSTGASLHPIKTSDSTHHHHHHVTSPISRLFLIGIQTAMAITLHKFPEGFITYVTSETNPELGITIFLSLLLHNFTEGFSICLPLYYSFESGVSKRHAKLKAFLISGTLAGLSQPLGALGGYIFLKLNNITPGSDLDTSNLNQIFGITMAVTSGFLSVVGLSMYGSAIGFGGSLNFVMMWCVTGIILIGLSSVWAS